MSELIETITGHPNVEGGEFIVLRGELPDAVMMYSKFSLMDDEYAVEGGAEFVSDFEVFMEDALGDPEDSFYQVITFTTVYRRRADGKLFGCSYTGSPGNDTYEYSNEGLNPYEALGVKWDWESDEPEPLVLLPVTAFQRVGYRVSPVT